MSDDERLNEQLPGKRRVEQLEHQVKAVPTVTGLAIVVILICGIVYGFSPPIILGLILFISVLVGWILLEHFYE